MDNLRFIDLLDEEDQHGFLEEIAEETLHEGVADIFEPKLIANVYSSIVAMNSTSSKDAFYIAAKKYHHQMNTALSKGANIQLGQVIDRMQGRTMETRILATFLGVIAHYAEKRPSVAAMLVGALLKNDKAIGEMFTAVGQVIQNFATAGRA